MVAAFIRVALAILLIPVDIAYACVFYEQLSTIRQVRPPELAFLLGVTAYLAFHVLVIAPTRLYVFGHELMHAIATWMTGGQVKGFHVGSKSGSVKATGINTFSALAPYFVPVYAVLWALLYGIFSLFRKTAPWSQWFFFGLGVTLTFHLVFTVDVLKRKQPDLETVGPILALGLILWVNMALVIAAISLVIPEVHFWRYLVSGFHGTQEIYQGLLAQLFVR